MEMNFDSAIYYRYDPRAEGAVVMKAPTKEHSTRFNKKCATPHSAALEYSSHQNFQVLTHCSCCYRSDSGTPVETAPSRRSAHFPTGVIVNSTAILGVKFMYECVMGLRKHEGQGCILADEMYGFLLS